MENLAINLVYRDVIQSWRFEDLALCRGVMDPEYLDVQEYFFLPGGMELICNNHFIFFQSFDYYDVLDCVSFLLDTLSVAGLYKGDMAHENLNEARLKNTSKDLLIFSNLENGSIKLSYKNNSEFVSRNNFYFDEIIIQTQLWINACKVALDEYFKVTKRILDGFENKDKESILRKYLCDWEQFSLR